VALGGMCGAVLRYVMGSLVPVQHQNNFPFGTLLVNLIGCLLIGYLFSRFSSSSEWYWIKPFLLIGVLGGFTTFSSFSLESLQLLQAGKTSSFVIYIFLSNGLGLLFTLAGNYIGK